MLKNSREDIKILFSELTDKQRDVLACLIFEFSYKAMGETLKISPRTVEEHIRAICRKTDIHGKNSLRNIFLRQTNKELNEELKERFSELKGNNLLSKRYKPNYTFDILKSFFHKK